jgi:hypothetical protein
MVSLGRITSAAPSDCSMAPNCTSGRRVAPSARTPPTCRFSGATRPRGPRRLSSSNRPWRAAPVPATSASGTNEWMARTAISSFGLERFPAGRSAPIDDPRERERRRAECVTVKYLTARPVARMVLRGGAQPQDVEHRDGQLCALRRRLTQLLQGHMAGSHTPCPL